MSGSWCVIKILKHELTFQMQTCRILNEIRFFSVILLSILLVKLLVFKLLFFNRNPKKNVTKTTDVTTLCI